MATLNIARQQAHKLGIKIIDKKEIKGYKVSEDIMTDSILTELYYWDWSGKEWIVYDFNNFDSYDEARDSGKILTRGN